MKKLIVFLLIGLFVNSIVSAQKNHYIFLNNKKKDVPTYLINSRILVGDLIANDSTIVKKIKSLKVYKSNETPKNIYNLGQYGIIDISVDREIDTKTIPEIKKWFNIKDEKVKIAIDGFILDNESLLIATDAISEINVIKKDNKIECLNIWTLTPNNRDGIKVIHDERKICIR